MASTPLIKTRDGSGTTTSLVLSTNLEFITLTGTIETNIISIQVSINDAPFVSDPTLVFIDGTSFTFPNPSAYQDGFPLELGVTTIRLRGIDIIGGVSAPALATLTRVSAVSEADNLTPTAIRLRRERNAVRILAATPDARFATVNNPSFLALFDLVGYNFYASATPSTGYVKVNQSPISTVSTTFEEDLIDLGSPLSVVSAIDPNADVVKVRVTQVDRFGNELSLVSDTEQSVEASPGGDMKFTSTLQFRRLTEFIEFRHVRAGGDGIVNSDEFVDVPDSDPLYYVVTGVFLDSTNQTEFETPFSQEVLGAPLIIDTTIRDLPGRNQIGIVQDFVAAIQRVDQEISLIPGSTTRDVEIDPFASEAERIWFIIDFVHRSQSFLTLLQIDDANGDGITDPVAGSAYKTALKAALGLATDQATQRLIDAQFDKLAGNFKRSRLPGRPSVGQAVFFTTTRPTLDITIASGTIVSTDSDATTSSVRFRVGGTFVLPAASADAFFNFNTQRYEVIADIVAETIGVAGNRPAGTIKNVQGSVGDLQVTNTESTVFGTDLETNAQLADRAQLAFISVDTGTEGGYAATSAGQIGILKTKIVKSGDPLMMRDYDEIRHKHIGGKVDIWIQGLRERTVAEIFAFTFEEARDIRCQIVDLTNLIFRVLDSRVTPSTPITEILNNTAQGLGVRNVTTGQDYDLTGVVLLDYQTFQVNTSIAQPVTAIDDIITADYRFRAVNQFVPTFQPVRRVISVVGEVSGPLDIEDGFDLFKIEDPLLEGESTIASDYVQINQILGVPSGASITVNNEVHVMIAFFEERLQSIGINTSTIRVFDQPRVVEYDGPLTASPDFEIIAGTATTPARIVRTASSAIVSGQTVSVDYDHDENFTVTYVVNDLLRELQNRVNVQRHVTADVLAKQAVQNSVDLDTTVQLKLGAKKDTVDPAIRSNVSIELNQKLIGQGTAQSDQINAIDSTTGVDFQVLPLVKMGYADGSRRLRESVLSSFTRLNSLDIGGNVVYLLNNPLQYPTTDGGGLETEHKGIFQNDEPRILSSTLALIGQFPNQGFIIGAGGAVVTGYSDDATLIADGFTDPDDIEVERLRRTANHVVVSLPSAAGKEPTDYSYAVSYVIRGDRGPHDLTASQVEFIDLGSLTLTIREATSTSNTSI